MSINYTVSRVRELLPGVRISTQQFLDCLNDTNKCNLTKELETDIGEYNGTITGLRILISDGKLHAFGPKDSLDEIGVARLADLFSVHCTYDNILPYLANQIKNNKI